MPTLGKRFGDWLSDMFLRVRTWYIDTPFGKVQRAVFDALERRPDATTEKLLELTSNLSTPGHNLLTMVLATITGTPLPSDFQKQLDMGKKMAGDPAQLLELLAKQLGEAPLMTGVEEALGGLLSGLLLAPLEDMLDAGIDDPRKFVERVHGVHAALIMAGGALGLAAEITGVGQIKMVGETLFAVFEGMGISRIGYRVIAPLMEIGVGESQKRYYQNRYRPRRWTAGELVQLFGLGEIDQTTLVNEMRELGYREDDINRGVRLSQQRLQVGDIFMAYDLNVIDVNTVVQFLQSRGFAPEDINFLVGLQDAKHKQTDLDAIASVADKAFTDDLISEQRYRDMKQAAKVPPERIDLDVQLLSLAKKHTKASLTLASIKSAYMVNRLSKQEALHFMEDAQIDDVARPIILSTWDAEKAPKHLVLNSNTITEAYTNGIFNREQAITKLKGVGWSSEDAALLLALADARAGGKVRTLTETAVTTAFSRGLLSADEALTLLEQLGLTADIGTTILKLVTLRPTSGTRALTDAQVIKLLQIGQFNEADAIDYMITYLNYDEQTAGLVILAETTKLGKTQTAPGG